MQDLATLVNSLTSSEKQHFKKRHHADRDFILLFDCINKYKELSNEDALVYINKKSKKGKKVTSSYLSVVKSYLKNRILESLRIQYINKRESYELLSRSMNADILVEKGLYELAKKEISQAQKRVEDSSFPIEKLLLMRRQSLIAYFENYEDFGLEKIQTLYESRIEAAE